MYVKSESVNEINFLASAKYQNFTYQVDDTDIVANGYEFVSLDTDNAPVYHKGNIQIVKRKGIGGDNVVISYKGGK